ncbi:hypothetical protein F2Q69_00036144 [Brassica cretica]|uniref:Uncharacterized protein n=1 Tax=Brassica cretica TaxID=69181 RepID=A0A8S9SNU7_BRACR|nr:hypothetical protein F2Q69_00036144 [Brassica cretica]
MLADRSLIAQCCNLCLTIDHASIDLTMFQSRRMQLGLLKVEKTRVLPTVMCAVAEEGSLCYTGRSIDDECERRIDHDSIDRSAGYDIDSIDRSAGWVIQYAIDRSLERKVGPIARAEGWSERMILMSV